MTYSKFGLRQGDKWYNGFSWGERMKVGRWQNKQYESGFPKPTECDACSQTSGLMYHHCEDYSEPYGAHIWQFPLCYRCHIMLHCRFFAPEAFTGYAKLVEDGYQFAPMYKMNFGSLKQDHINVPGARTATYQLVDPRGTQILTRCAAGEWTPTNLDELVREGQDKPRAPKGATTIWAGA